MLILIEGPDETGKTTLAKEISKAYGLPYVHRGPPTLPPLEEYGEGLWGIGEIRHGLPRGVIDRWHLGQVVYPQLYPEGRTPLGDVERLWIDLVLLAAGAFCVGTYGMVDKIEQRIERTNVLAAAGKGGVPSYLQHEDVERCLLLFQDVYRTTLLDVALHDIDRRAILDADAVAPHAQDLATRAALLAEFNVVGEPYAPNVLLVGEQVNTPWTNLPFAPESGSSGRYLLEALLMIWGRTDLARTLLVNALDRDGHPQNLLRLYRLAGQPRVVALGNAASEVLSDAGVLHGVVPHPQYVRRFHHQTKREYAWALAVAALNGNDFRTLWRGGS